MINNDLFHISFYSDNDTSFDKLKQIKSKYVAAIVNGTLIYYSAYNFLHGYCLVFVYALHMRFGYDVILISNNSGTEEHCCCYKEYLNHDVYIDVRGGTTNLNKLLQPFSNIDCNYPKNIKNY